ncbi:MAG: ribonuclease R [Oscillospiraceae bacterium]|nr:ribonuclease R [Oscillospiraceae bacterium]
MREKKETKEGIYWSSGRNYGFVTQEDGDIFLPPHCSGQAWHGDRVAVELDPVQVPGGRPAGRVVAVLERANVTVAGRVDRIGKELWLTPDGGKLPAIKLVGGHASLRHGDKAEASVRSYGSRKEPPLAIPLRTFGRDGTRQAATEAILARHAVPRVFPPEVLQAAEQTPAEVPAAALEGRLDLRGSLVITIDGPMAKDLDDAVSLERGEDGTWRLGVHIADVSHYVSEGSALEQEAWRRGTSVYFADQVIPMLPEALSNGICSLNPQVDRLTLSCLMTLDRQGQVLGHAMAKTVIRTTERMSYPDCNTLLKGEDQALATRYKLILPMLRQMAELARALGRKRRLRGALELESTECSVLCDRQGDPVEIQRRTPGESERIIEEFMLAANETVAEHLSQAGRPGVYRVHEEPDEGKIERFRQLAAQFGYALDTPDSFGMQKVLDGARGRPEEGAISMLLLRSLMKARYGPENLGHFGLAAEFYCHFTSPIRRYPDLMIHRILSALLDGTLTGSREQKLRIAAAEAAAQSTQREVEAETAERDIEKCYMAEYMQSRLGEQFSGLVSGVTRFGLFVLLSNGVEGLLPVSSLPDDSYEYSEERMELAGLRTGRVYSFAMPVEVICAAADPGAGEVTLDLAEKPETFGQKPPSKQRKERGRSRRSGRPPMHTPKKRRRRR